MSPAPCVSCDTLHGCHWWFATCTDSGKLQLNCVMQLLFPATRLMYLKSQYCQAQVLQLCGNRIGASGVGVLAAALPKLHDLSLDGNNLDMTAMTQLVQGKWACLEVLSVCNNHLNDTAVFHLVSRKWQALRCVKITKGNEITAEGLEKMRSVVRDAV